MDATGYNNYPLGTKTLDDDTIAAFGRAYALFAPIASLWAKIAYEHPTWGVAKGKDGADQSTVMGGWKITAQFDQWQMGERDWTRSEEHTSELQPLMRISYAVFCLKKKKKNTH